VCAITATQIGPILFWTGCEFRAEFFSTYLRTLCKKRVHMVILCEMVLQHTCSINILDEIFENRPRLSKLRPARSPELNPCNVYVRGKLETKYSYNPYTGWTQVQHYVKQLHPLRSVMSNWCQSSKETLSLFESRMETFWAFTMMMYILLKNLFTLGTFPCFMGTNAATFEQFRFARITCCPSTYPFRRLISL
jgi:hypothetical protein